MCCALAASVQRTQCSLVQNCVSFVVVFRAGCRNVRRPSLKLCLFVFTRIQPLWLGVRPGVSLWGLTVGYWEESSSPNQNGSSGHCPPPRKLSKYDLEMCAFCRQPYHFLSIAQYLQLKHWKNGGFKPPLAPSLHHYVQCLMKQAESFARPNV